MVDLDDISFAVNYAHFLMQTNQLKEAYELLQLLLDRDPGNKLVIISLSRVLIRSNKKEEASKLYHDN